MFLVYDVIFFIFSLAYIPVYLLRRKFHKGFSQRLGNLPKELDLSRPIWVHAVSVGEVMAVRGLIEILRKNYPNKKLVISTVTATGNKIAKNLSLKGDLVIYLPLDFSFIVRKVINRINPCAFIIAETEIWPNLTRRLYKNRIPVITVNGRISDASFKGYMSIRMLIKPVLNRFRLFCVQTNRDAARLKNLGVLEDKIKVTGNMKFDSAAFSDNFNSERGRICREKLGLAAGDKLLVCGSTHPGEEEMLFGAYRELLQEFGNLKLLIAPRHPERVVDIKRIVKSPSVFILDTVGELMNYYAAADIVFMGGSLVRHGGQNILEPASVGKPVIFGPFMFNFRDIADEFLSSKAAIMIHSPQELTGVVAGLLKDDKRVQSLVESARRIILNNQGATLRNADLIRKTLAAPCSL